MTTERERNAAYVVSEVADPDTGASFTVEEINEAVFLTAYDEDGCEAVTIEVTPDQVEAVLAFAADLRRSTEGGTVRAQSTREERAQALDLAVTVATHRPEYDVLALAEEIENYLRGETE